MSEPLVPAQYCFQSHSVRVFVSPMGEPWFVAVDVCAALSLSNSSLMISRLDSDEKMDGVCITDPIGRQQRGSIISESGLYSLILTSRKPEAKAFKRWVTHQVLPSIRRTGGYEMEEHKEWRGRRSWLPDFIAFCDEAEVDVGLTLRTIAHRTLARREKFRELADAN